MKVKPTKKSGKVKTKRQRPDSFWELAGFPRPKPSQFQGEGREPRRIEEVPNGLPERNGEAQGGRR